MKTGYKRYTWDFGETIETEEKHTGNFGAPGQERARKRDPTPEDIARQNQWRRERDVRRLIKWNFGKADYWVTLTYPKGTRPDWKQMDKDVQAMIRKLRRRYKKLGQELKYIYRLAIGRRGGQHIHIMVNRISGTDVLLQECWPHGHVNIRMTYEEGGYENLAKYIVKPLEPWEPEELRRFHPSRNLIRKEPKTEEINRRSLVDKEGQMKPIRPKKGYYVDPASIRFGRNPVTGYFYRHYTMVKIDRRI